MCGVVSAMTARCDSACGIAHEQLHAGSRTRMHSICAAGVLEAKALLPEHAMHAAVHNSLVSGLDCCWCLCRLLLESR